LSAASINGQFSSFITLPAMFNASLQQTATEVDLIVNSGLAKVSGLTGNQQAVANALDNAFNSGQGTLAGLTGLSPSQFAAALSILSGEGLSGTQESALGAGGLVLDTLQQQALDGLGGDGGGASASASAQYSASGSALGYAAEKKKHKDVPAVLKAMPLKAPVFEPRWRAWSAGFGGSWRLNGQGDTGSADIRHSTGGGMAGLDHLVAPNVLVGAAVGGSASNFSVPDRATSGTLDGVNVGLYGGARQGSWYATAAVTFAAFDNKTSRTIAGVGPTELANARFDSDLWGGRIETGYRFAWGTAVVTPFAAVQPTELRVAGFTESSTTLTGAPGVLGLTAPSHTVDSLPTFVGVQFDQHLTLANMAWSPYGRVSWVHEFRPTRDITASFVTLPAAGFTVFGPRAARDAVRIDAGSRLQVSRNVYLFDSFDGEFAQGSQLYSGKGGVTIAW